MTGLVFATFVWEDLLEGLFPVDTSGIDIVVSTKKDAYTYTIVRGQVVLVGEGDLHQDAFSESRKGMDIAIDGLAEASVAFTINFYANDSFDEPFHSDSKNVAAIGAAALVVLTSCLFFLYDVLVLRQHNAQKQLLEAKRQFVRFISHEVRTPLNSVVMGLFLMQEELSKALGWDPTLSAPSPSSLNLIDEESHARMEPTENMATSTVINRTKLLQWRQVTQEVHSNAQSSVDVLNDLLNYDKVESGTLSLELTVVPIWSLIRQTTQEFELPATTKHIEFDLNLPEGEDGQNVVGDSVRLTQVIRNLCSNAIKFTPEGGSLKIRAYSTKAGRKENMMSESFKLKTSKVITSTRSGTLIFEVRDSGAGMTKDQISHLFRMGVQFNVNDLQAGNGSGLGLYIARGEWQSQHTTAQGVTDGILRLLFVCFVSFQASSNSIREV